MAESIAIVSTEDISPSAFEDFLRDHGAERGLDSEFVITADGETIYVSGDAHSVNYVLEVSEGLIANRLSSPAKFCCDARLSRQNTTDRLAKRFALAFMQRWSGILYDYSDDVYDLAQLQQLVADGKNLLPIG